MDPSRVKRHKADSAFFVNEQGWSAVHEAAANNNVEAMKELLGHNKARQKKLMNIEDLSGRIPLALALRNPATSVEMIRLLIDSGSDVNYKSWYNAPLWHAVNSGNLDHVKLLMAAGACANGSFDPMGDTALHYAASAKNLQMLRYFLDICNNVNHVNKSNKSALHCACNSNFTKGVELLLKYVDRDTVVMKAHHGNYLLDVAVEKDNEEMLEMLSAAGATVTERAVEYCYLSESSKLLQGLVDTSFDTVFAVLRSQFFDLFHRHQIEYMLQVLQNHEDCDKLEREMLDEQDVLDEVSDDKDYKMYMKLSVFFEYYFTHEPKDLFCKVVRMYPDELYGIRFMKMLSEFGVRGCWSEKQTFFQLWEDSDLSDDDEFPEEDAAARKEAVANLQQPVLDLKRLSAMAARSHIRHYTGSNWMARLMVQESALPTICKQQLFLQFVAAP